MEKCKECGKAYSDIEILAQQVFYDDIETFIYVGKFERSEFVGMFTDEQLQIFRKAQAAMEAADSVIEELINP